MLELRPQVQAALAHIEGLCGVGIGIRERAGNLTGELVFRIYVDRKQPESALAADQIIPKEVAGFPTDVVVIGYAQNLCWDKGTRPVIGGLEVSPSPFDAMEIEYGTVTCIVTDPNGKTAVLSCEHVIQHQTQTDLRVWQPHYKSCVGFHCNKIGVSAGGYKDNHHIDGTAYWVDAAFATVDDDIGTRNVIRRVTNPSGPNLVTSTLPPNTEGTVMTHDGKVVVLRDENDRLIDTTRIAGTAPAVPGTLVWKIGRRSNYTVGYVTDFHGPVKDRDKITGDITSLENVITIAAVAGYENEGIARFGDHGDSGSAVFDLDNNIVGILTGIFALEDPHDHTKLNHFTYACHIFPVLDVLGVTINKSPTPVVPSGETLEDVEPEDFGSRLHELEARVRATATGPTVLDLLTAHGVEAYDLVVHRRAVTVAWHRNRGPSFAARLARAIRENTDSLPTEVDGTSLNTMILAMATALRTHGSPALRAALDNHEPWLRDLLVDCTSVSELMRRLETVPGINA